MSKARPFDPHRLDVAAFARAQGHLAGHWPLAGMRRLVQDAVAPVPTDETVGWSARGEWRPVAGAEAEIWLHLHAAARVQLICQRCMQPMAVMLDVRPAMRFVQGEELAAQIDEHSEDDVLALGAALDLHELIEDELILALPLVPRHDACRLPLPYAPEGEAAKDASGSPFAGLAAMRRSRDAPN